MNINLERTLEALTHLICSEQAARDYGSRTLANHHRLSADHFDGFELFTTEDEDNEDFILMGDNPNDLPVWPLDVCMCAKAHEEWPEGTWQFMRLRTLNMKLWRNKLRTYAPRMIEQSVLVSRPSGQNFTTLNAYALFGKTMQEATGSVDTFGWGDTSVAFAYGADPGWFGRRGFSKDDEEIIRMSTQMRIAAGLSLRRHYLWSVLLGEGHGPRARFSTDPIGVREVFRLRDIPPGRQRRAALLHWVKAHWRKSRALSADDRAWVRAYLRGTWSYTWNGLLCQIEPSVEDMQTVSHLKQQRPAERS